MGNKISQFKIKHLMIIVAIIALAIIGASGYMYLKYVMVKNNSINQNPVDIKTISEEQLVSDVSKWTILDTKFFKMPVPDGWELFKLLDDKSGDELGLVITPYGLKASQALTYERNVKSVVGDIKQPIGHNFISNFVIDYRIGHSRGQLENIGYTKDTSLTTKDGVEVLKYHQNHTILANDYFGNPVDAGTIEYVYIFNVSEGINVEISYFISPKDQVDNIKQLERSIKSIMVKKVTN